MTAAAYYNTCNDDEKNCFINPVAITAVYTLLIIAVLKEHSLCSDPQTGLISHNDVTQWFTLQMTHTERVIIQQDFCKSAVKWESSLQDWGFLLNEWKCGGKKKISASNEVVLDAYPE